MNETTLSDRVLHLVQLHPGITDRDMTSAVYGDGAAPQRINQECRKLEECGKLTRRKGPDGRLGNYLSDFNNGSDPQKKVRKQETNPLSKIANTTVLERWLPAYKWMVTTVENKVAGKEPEVTEPVDGWFAEAKSRLKEIQKLKLALAAKILKNTTELYEDVCSHTLKRSLLPLWAAGVVTHAQPKAKQMYVVGITKSAQNAKNNCTDDHLFRVTATAEFILARARFLAEEDIQNILIVRSIKMTTTRAENSGTLKHTVKKCKDPDDWQELYRVAGVEYDFL